MSRLKYTGLVPGPLDSGRVLAPEDLVDHDALTDADRERLPFVDVQVPGSFDPGRASDSDIAAWLTDAKPTAQDVIDAARDDPHTAGRLLAAEQAGQNRKTAVAGLDAIVNHTPDQESD